MKIASRLILATVVIVMTASCASQKRAWYIQDAKSYTPEQIIDKGQIRIKPLDRLTVVVNSRTPELAVPFNSSTSLNSLSGGPTTSSSTQSLQIRTVDENGDLDMPIIGKVKCNNMTRNELSQEIAKKIMDGGYINDPTINVQFADMKLSVIGEVTRPGQYNITQDRISIFDALAMAGDLTIFGIRNEVAVTRENNGVRTIEYIDLTSKDIFNSPAFYLQQNDVIYVKPNKYKTASGEISQNRNFYLSMIGTVISVTTLIVTLTKK